MNAKMTIVAAAAMSSALFTIAFAHEARAACSGRPTDAAGYQSWSYAAAEVKSYATAHVRVHYATTGEHSPELATTRGDSVPDTVAFAADTGENAVTQYEAKGFKKIPSDAACTSNGGDDKIDIYLVHFQGADGSTAPECPTASTAGCSSFMLVESTFSGKGYANAEEGFKTVVTHELFHAVQNVYRSKLDPFWAEGTAQWAMKLLHPELKDFERQMPAFFKEPSRSLDAVPSGSTAGYLYGSSVWPLFLTLKYDPDVVKEILETQESANKEAIPATDDVLKKHSASLADAYPLFAAWNAGTSAKQPSTGGYPDAAKYPGVTIAALKDGATAITSGLSYYVYKGTLDAPSQIAFDGDVARLGGVVVPIEGGSLALDKAKKLPANAEGEVLVAIAGVTTKKTDAPFTIKFGPPGEEIPPEGGTSSSGSTSSTSSGGGASSGGDDEGCRASPRRGDKPLSSDGLMLVCLGALVIAVRSRRK